MTYQLNKSRLIMFDFSPFIVSFWGNNELVRKYKNVTQSSRSRLDKILGYGLRHNLIDASMISTGNSHASLLFEVKE